MWCLPSPSRSMHVKNLRSGGKSAGEGKERKKVELADLLSFGERIKRRVAEGARRERHWRCFFLAWLPLDACARVHSEEKERLLAVYCSHEKAATTRQALKIPLSFLFDIFTFSTPRIVTLA